MIGRTGTWSLVQGDVTIQIVCKATRRAYGRFELLVAPIHGTGEAWVREAFVEFEGRPPKTKHNVILEPKSAFKR